MNDLKRLFPDIGSLIRACEQDAINHFGFEVVGTPEGRTKLPPKKKEQVLNFLLDRCEFYTGSRPTMPEVTVTWTEVRT